MPDRQTDKQTNKQRGYLTPRSTVRLAKLSCSQLVNKFPAFYGTRRFVTAFTRARHQSCSDRDQSSLCHNPTSWNSVCVILPSTLGSTKGFLSLRFSHWNPVCTSPLPHPCYVPCTSNFHPCIDDIYIYMCVCVCVCVCVCIISLILYFVSLKVVRSRTEIPYRINAFVVVCLLS